MTTAWLVAAGMRSGLSHAEALTALPGEIQDLCACAAIAAGARQKITVTTEELDRKQMAGKKTGGEVRWQ